MKNHYCRTRTCAEEMQANPVDGRTIAADTGAGGELDDFSPAEQRVKSRSAEPKSQKIPAEVSSDRNVA